MSLEHGTQSSPSGADRNGHGDHLRTLTDWLKDVAERFKAGERPDVVIGPFGAHPVGYGNSDEDDYGPYAVVNFGITEAYDVGWFTEVEDGTYGRLMGFRIYLNEIEGADG